MVDGNVTDQFGNYSSGFYAEYNVEIGRITFTSAFLPQQPLGSLVYDPVMNGRVGAADDVDEFALVVDAGQSISIALTTDSQLRGRIELRRGNRVVAAADATAPGADVLIQNDPTTGRLIGGTSDELVVRVSGLDGTTGGYELGLLLNAAYETEFRTTDGNDTLAAAESLEGAFRAVRGNSPEFAAVVSDFDGELFALEDFEAGELLGAWTSNSSTDEGRIRVTGDFTTTEGKFALIMDVAEQSTPNINEAIWTVDLSGREEGILSFDHVSFSDELQTFAGPFAGSYAADGISISTNGINWFPIFDPPDTAFAEWNRYQLDLIDLAEQAGLDLATPLQIKFQQFDDFPLARDGRGWDNIQIRKSDPSDWYRFSMSRGDVVTVVGTTQSANAELSVDLFDSDGQLVAEGLERGAGVQNGSFETGLLDGWQTLATGEMPDPWAVAGKGGAGNNFIDSATPQDGEFVAWNGFDGDGPLESILYQDVWIPDDAEKAVVSWRQRVQWFYIASDAAPRRLEFQIQDDQSAVLDTPYVYATPPGNESRLGDSGWLAEEVDLMAYRGQSVRLAFVTIVPESFVGPGQVEIDGVSIDFGNSSFENVTDAIESFESSRADDYYVRVTGDNAAEYSLSLMRNVGFNLDAADGSLQRIDSPVEGGRRWQLGHVDVTEGPDRYALNLTRGRLAIESFTPAGNDGEFTNLFDPILRLYDPDGNLVAEDDNSGDGIRNAALVYSVPNNAQGIYTLEISGAEGPGSSGEYLLSLQGAISENAIAAAVDAALDDDSLFM